jgi:hypothetical protein
MLKSAVQNCKVKGEVIELTTDEDPHADIIKQLDSIMEVVHLLAEKAKLKPTVTDYQGKALKVGDKLYPEVNTNVIKTVTAVGVGYARLTQPNTDEDDGFWTQELIDEKKFILLGGKK